MTRIDVEAARLAFEESTDGTVGLEEEFAILDPDELGLVPQYERLAAAAADRPVLAESVTPDLIQSEIEIRSGRGETLADALASQRAVRRELFELAEEQNVALGATGTHPWSDYREQEFIQTDHYQRVADGLQWVARRNNTFSLHVHTGVRGADRAVRTCDRLRPVLPLLLALSASSPFLDARDSGLHSARTQSFTKVFPRCGIPDAYGSWDVYADYIEMLSRTRSIVEYTQVWWAVRPHFSFGTVELRICDVQSTSTESDALAALAVACIAQAARDEEEGRPHVDHPRRLLEENFWRAIRFGLDGEMLDFDAGADAYPAAGIADRLLGWTAPVRAELGLGEPAFPERNSAQRQRGLLADGETMTDVYARTVRETRETYSQEVRA